MPTMITISEIIRCNFFTQEQILLDHHFSQHRFDCGTNYNRLSEMQVHWQNSNLHYVKNCTRKITTMTIEK